MRIVLNDVEIDEALKAYASKKLNLNTVHMSVSHFENDKGEELSEYMETAHIEVVEDVRETETSN